MNRIVGSSSVPNWSRLQVHPKAPAWKNKSSTKDNSYQQLLSKGAFWV